MGGRDRNEPDSSRVGQQHVGRSDWKWSHRRSCRGSITSAESTREARTVWADAGVVWSTLDVEARRRGLRFPVDPSSGSFCTIGGMVATNASGPHTLRYGSTRAWVNAIDCVFSDGDRAVITRGEPPPKRVGAIARFMRDVHGEIVASDKRRPIRHEGVRKESSGYAIHDYSTKADLVDLLVGSEGTLAIIVAVQLSLSPVPAATSSILGSFQSLEEATAAATKAVAAGASTCELLDKTFLAYAGSGRRRRQTSRAHGRRRRDSAGRGRG